MRANHLRVAVLGAALGFGLSSIGFSDWGEVHRMFVFSDLRLFLTFIGGVTLTMVGFLLASRGMRLAPRPMHPGVVPGGILFGVGWALTGACPSIMLVQIGEGQLQAVWTLAGVVLGTAAYPRIHRRLFRWDPGSCEA